MKMELTEFSIRLNKFYDSRSIKICTVQRLLMVSRSLQFCQRNEHKTNITRNYDSVGRASILSLNYKRSTLHMSGLNSTINNIIFKTFIAFNKGVKTWKPGNHKHADQWT